MFFRRLVDPDRMTLRCKRGRKEADDHRCADRHQEPARCRLAKPPGSLSTHRSTRLVMANYARHAMRARSSDANRRSQFERQPRVRRLEVPARRCSCSRSGAATVGKKIVMAVTGAILIVFLVGHLAGNLLVFRGAAGMDAYSAFLKRELLALWAVRAVLFVSVVLHVVAAAQLAMPGPHRAAAELRPVEAAGRDARLEDHADRRPSHRRLRRLPPPAPDHRHHPSRAVRGDARLRQRGGRIPRLVGDRALRGGDDRHRPAPLPRRLELVAHARASRGRRRSPCTGRSPPPSPSSSGQASPRSRSRSSSGW